MARSRNIKPGFFKNEVLAELKPLTRLLFAGLWCLADREGRLEDRPKKIKVEILPYDNCNIDQLLDELTSEFIVRYEVEGKKYIQINNFTKHQNPHKNEVSSTIPEYSGIIASTSVKIASDTDKIGSTRADSLLLVTDSLLLNTDSLNPDSFFDVFWKAYPKKKSKEDARKAWKKLKADDTLLNKILSTIEQAKKSKDWLKDNGQFIPHPATWLNGKRWEDDYSQGSEPKEKRSEKYGDFYL